MNRFLALYRFSLVLAVCCLFLVGIIYSEWRVHRQQYADFSARLEQTLPHVKTIEALEGMVDMQQSSVDYSVIEAQPLFYQGRKPIESSHGTAQTSRDQLELKLRGVVFSANEYLALVQDHKNINYRLHQGDQIFGWDIIAVRPNSVALRRANQTLQLFLVENTAKVPAELSNPVDGEPPPEETFQNPGQLPYIE